MQKYKIWDCKIVTPLNSEMPDGFDSPPRCAAMEAIEKAGIDIITCFSDWGGTLSDIEQKIVERDAESMVSRAIFGKE